MSNVVITVENGLVLTGGGGHAKSVIDAIPNWRMREYGNVVILDPHLTVRDEVCGIRVAGDDGLAKELFESGYRDAFVSTGSIKNTKVRHKLYDLLTEHGFQLINVIDQTSIVAKGIVFGRGVFIGKRAVINAGSHIDDMTIINTGAIVEHDCRIGQFVHVAVGAVLCGEVTVEEDAFIGAGATVTNGRTIGQGAVVGAGSTVLRDVKPHETVYGIVK